MNQIRFRSKLDETINTVTSTSIKSISNMNKVGFYHLNSMVVLLTMLVHYNDKFTYILWLDQMFIAFLNLAPSFSDIKE